MTCTVSGNLIAITGVAAPGASVVVQATDGLHPSGSRTVLPGPETFVADGSGTVTMPLEPGRYRMAWADRGVVYSVSLSVPDEATADLADLLVEAPVPVRGTPGREVEIRNNAGDIEWRYVGDPWSLLIPVSDYLPTAAIGTVTTGAPGTAASVANVGAGKDAVFDFTIPRGDFGPPGPAPDVEAVVSPPVSPDPDTLYVITGAPATIEVGSVAASAPGGAPMVSNSGTPSNAVFDFTIPRGDVGPIGPAPDVEAVVSPPASPDPDTLYVITGMPAPPKIETVLMLPASPDPNTLYIVSGTPTPIKVVDTVAEIPASPDPYTLYIVRP